MRLEVKMRHFSSHPAAGRLAMSANPPRGLFSRLLLLPRLPLLLLLMSLLCCAQVRSRSSDLEPWQTSDWAVSSIKATRGQISGARLSPTSGHQAALEWRSMPVQGVKSGRRLHSRTSPRTRRSRNQCSQTCTNEKDVTCHITKRSNMCIHKAESVTDFPNRPRNLGIEKTQVGDKIHFNISWKGPYDYSYKAVTGYEVHVSRFEVGFSSPLVDCYFMNLSATNWSAVPSVHEVVYFVDCAWIWAASYRKVHVKVFSYPKVAGQHEVKATDAWIYPERIELKNPSLDWHPSIVAVPDVKNRSLIVTVSPLHPDIAYLKLCISHVSSLPCVGRIFPMESPHNAFRYRVEDLATNASYYIYVQPFNSQGEELDIWIHKKNPITVPPWPQGTTEPTPTSTSSSVSTTSQPPKPPVTKTGVGLEVVAVLVVMVVLLSLALVLGCWLYRRGYLQKIQLLRLCFPQAGFPGQPIKVLQLYVREETGIFHRLVKTHKDLLCEHLSLECLDCEELRHQKNMGLWLDQDYITLVYLSPRLVYELLQSQDSRVRRDTGLQNPLLAKKVDHIHRLASSGSLSRRRCWSRRRPPLIFILPDCWATDLSEELAQLGVFKHVPRFHISSPPQPLLSALQGYRPTVLTTYQPGNEASQDLSTTIRTLVLTIQGAQGQYYSGGCMNGLAGGDCDGSPHGESNGHACTGTVAGRLVHPHRTDSGFSSSAADHHRGGSNSSSEPTSQRVENGEEENTETDPMIQENMRNLSVSQMSMVFLPPESVGGDEDSVVISNHFRRLNTNGDWSS